MYVCPPTSPNDIELNVSDVIHSIPKYCRARENGNGNPKTGQFCLNEKGFDTSVIEITNKRVSISIDMNTNY